MVRPFLYAVGRSSGFYAVCCFTLWSPIASAEPRVISGLQAPFAEDQTWEVASLELKPDAEIQTNGHKLTIKVAGDFRAQDGCKITRGPSPVASPAPTPEKAAKGVSYNPGPNTEGPGVRKGGKPGGDGAPGTDGAQGLAGLPGDDVTIIVGGTGVGKLIIDESGTPGGPGGPGGEGGDGGDGQQGGRGEPNMVFGVPVGAKAGPATGGKGGDGGRGGKGGDGGNGGAGGRVLVSVGRPSPNFHLVCNVSGGQPGTGGPGGKGGSRGRPGFGGRGGPGVEGRVNERMGTAGTDGLPGDAGRPGSAGANQKPEILGDVGPVETNPLAPTTPQP